MKGWFNRARDKWYAFSSSIKQTIANTVSDLTNRLIEAIPPPIRNLTYDMLQQIWLALRVINVNSHRILHQSQETKRLFYQATYRNVVLYALPFLLSDMIIKNITENEEDQRAQILNTWTIWFLLLCLYSRSKIRNGIENLAYNLSLPKAIKNDKEKLNIKENIQTLSKEKEEAAQSADINGLLDYVVDKGTALLIAIIPYYGSGAAYVLNSAAEGRVIAEYVLSAEKKNENERNEWAEKNRIFLLTFGFMFWSIYTVSCDAIDRMTGEKNSFVHAAIYNCLFQYFMVLALLNQKKPHGTIRYMDIFYSTHAIMSYSVYGLMKGFRFALSCLSRSKAKVDWINKMQSVAYYPSSQFILQGLGAILLYPDLQIMNRFVKNPAINLYLDYCGVTLEQVPASIDEFRSRFLLHLFNWLPLHLPGVRQLVPKEKHEQQYIVGVILGNRGKLAADYIKKMIESILDARRQYKVKCEEKNIEFKWGDRKALTEAIADQQFFNNLAKEVQEKKSKPTVSINVDKIMIADDKYFKQEEDEFPDWVSVPTKDLPRSHQAKSRHWYHHLFQSPASTQLKTTRSALQRRAKQ